MSLTYRNEPYETQINTDEVDSPRYTHHIENPYTLDVTRKAWAEGYQRARVDYDSGANEEEVAQSKANNPYTSGDTMTAWHQGYADHSYTPGVFDPQNPLTYVDGDEQDRVNEMNEWQKRSLVRTSLEILQSKPDDNAVNEVWLVWSTTYNSMGLETLSWKDNKPQDRGIKLDWNHARAMVMQSIHSSKLIGEGQIELPCPPYEFEAGVGELTITKGVFKKTGSKDDWQQVIDEMQQQLDEVPNGLNVEDEYVSVDVRLTGTVSISIPISSMVSTDGYGRYEGTKDELHDEITSALEYNDMSYEVREYIDAEGGNIDWDIDEYEASDLDYDLVSVEEL